MPNQQLSERIQHIIAYLQETWQRSQPISSDDLKRITEFVLNLPEEYQKIGLAKVAEYAVNNMSLHILNLMAIFQQYAEEEGIKVENVQKTLNYVLPDTFQVLSDLNSQVHIQSFDDVATLTNITTNLQVLSSSDTAEQAQSWLYELPTMYYQQLSQEKLTVNTYTSLHMAEQQGISGAPVLTSNGRFIAQIVTETEPVRIYSSTIVLSEKNLKITSDIKDDSKEDKSIHKNVLAA